MRDFSKKRVVFLIYLLKNRWEEEKGQEKGQEKEKRKEGENR